MNSTFNKKNILKVEEEEEDIELESFNIDDEEEERIQKKKKRKFTKEDAIYGVFKGDSEEEEEESKDEFGSKYAKPISFISETKLDGKENLSLYGIKEDEIEEKDNEPMLFLGQFQRSSSHNLQDESSLFIKKKKETKKELKKTTTNKDIPKSSDLKKYGIGSKLLEKMGWKAGQGLGKEKQGISRPIEVKMRAKQVGLGYFGDERTSQQKEDFGSLEEKEQEMIPTNDIKEMKTQGWKKKSGKIKKVYKLPSEIPIHQVKSQTIIDMTGEQPKVLNNIQEVYKESSTTATLYLPELQHNIKLLIDIKEADILTIDRKRNIESDTIQRLLKEQENLENLVKLEEEQMKRLNKIMEIINKCDQKVKTNSITIKQLASVFLTFEENFKEEYFMYKLYLLASALVFPLLKEALEKWNPLENPIFFIEEFSLWKQLLYKPSIMKESENIETLSNESVNTYTQLIVDLVLPKMRSSITNQWNVQQPKICLDLIETWANLLPSFILENILEQLILPKISKEIENWNPKQDKFPIHNWIHPWLSDYLLGSKLNSLFPIIRHKLHILLQDLNILDNSIYSIIAPWKNIFDSSTMENFLTRNIIPKLIHLLKELNINSTQESSELFNQIMLWEDIIPIQYMVNMLEAEFFPRWHQVLYTWLSNHPNYEDIVKWYLEWKQKFSNNLLNNEKIRTQFNYALSIMNSMVSGEPVIPILTTSTRNISSPSQSQIPNNTPSSNIIIEESHMSFKEMVEKYAEEHGFLLIPTKKRYEGKLIYTFGNIPVILDKDLVYKQESGEWKPVSLSDLVMKQTNNIID